MRVVVLSHSASLRLALLPVLDRWEVVAAHDATEAAASLHPGDVLLVEAPTAVGKAAATEVLNVVAAARVVIVGDGAPGGIADRRITYLRLPVSVSDIATAVRAAGQTSSEPGGDDDERPGPLHVIDLTGNEPLFAAASSEPGDEPDDPGLQDEVLATTSIPERPTLAEVSTLAPASRPVPAARAHRPAMPAGHDAAVLATIKAVHRVLDTIGELPVVCEIGAIADALRGEVRERVTSNLAAVLVTVGSELRVAAAHGLTVTERRRPVDPEHPFLRAVRAGDGARLVTGGDEDFDLTRGLPAARVWACAGLAISYGGLVQGYLLIGGDHLTTTDLAHARRLADEAAPVIALSLLLAQLRGALDGIPGVLLEGS